MSEHTPGPFDLMKDKPPLDVQTLNWIWDGLWRSRACNRQKNNEQRVEARVESAIMAIIEDEARAATAKATGG